MTTQDIFASTYKNVTSGIEMQMARGKFLEKKSSLVSTSTQFRHCTAVEGNTKIPVLKNERSHSYS